MDMETMCIGEAYYPCLSVASSLDGRPLMSGSHNHIVYPAIECRNWSPSASSTDTSPMFKLDQPPSHQMGCALPRAQSISSKSGIRQLVGEVAYISMPGTQHHHCQLHSRRMAYVSHQETTKGRSTSAGRLLLTALG